MKHVRKGLATAAAVTALGAFALQPNASAASSVPPADAEPEAATTRSDSLPNPYADKRRAEKIHAMNALLSGDAKLETRDGRSGAVVAGKFIELAVTGEDEIFVILTEFGDEIHPEFGGEPGPLHNEIPEPDREVDNRTIWQADYDQAHYEAIYGETDDDSYLSVANYVEEQSNGSYTVTADVSDWVQLDHNQARYGANAPEPPEGEDPAWTEADTYWPWVEDSANYWWDQNCVGGNADACIEQLAALDTWDRYDYDEDGVYAEPDGYLDHFQLVHAGVGEESCAPNCDDAIWSHRWHVNLDDVGFTGPTVPGTTNQNLHGGAPIGDSTYWVGDYTAQPENGGQGVFTHEYMHDLELPDLYDTGGAENDTGWWTLMSQGSYFADDRPAGSETPEGIPGEKGAGLSAWERSFLGWITPEDGSLYVATEGEQEITLGPAAPRSGDLPQAAVVNIPDRELVVDTPDPFSGDWSWWSFYGDNLQNTLETTEPIDLSGATEASLNASVAYEIETGYDYLHGEISTDGGLSWTRLNGTVDGEPIWEDGDVEGLDGSSDADGDGMPEWVDLTYDISPWAGMSDVTFRFLYATDGGFAPLGFFADEITIVVDGEEVLSDGAEEESGPWTADGFVRTGVEYRSFEPNRYWVENRQLSGADSGFDNSPYNYGFYDRPLWSERFPYQTGPLIWYNWDAFTDNNVSTHPGVGVNLPVDVQSELLEWEGDNNPDTSQIVRNRVQSYDATLSLVDTTPITLHRAEFDDDGKPDGQGETTFGPLDEVSLFDDVANMYWSEEAPSHGVILEPTGTQIELLSTQQLPRVDEVSTALRIVAPAATAPTPTPSQTATPTDPPSPTESPSETATSTDPGVTGTPLPTTTLPDTGGGNSSMLAGVGLVAVVAGALLVAVAARRLRKDS